MATVPLIPETRCTSSEVYGKDRVSVGMFCAGDLEGMIDSCQGDSGGPAVVDVQGRATLFGESIYHKIFFCENKINQNIVCLHFRHHQLGLWMWQSK